MSLHFSIETEPDPKDVAALGVGLTEHSLPIVGKAGFQTLAVFARDDAGKLVGGAQGLVNWTWLHIALLWVNKNRRHQGLGSELLRKIEEAGHAYGCEHVHLDTFSYQARPFYEHHGYELFATLDEYPPGHQRFFLRKRLVN